MMVVKRPNEIRPEIIPDEGSNHPFLLDYYKGITEEEAEKRVQEMHQITY